MEKAEHKKDVLDKSPTISSIRERARSEMSGAWKSQREETLKAKRVRYGSRLEEDITEEQVTDTAKAILEETDGRDDNLRYLRKAFTEGSIFIDAFLSVDGIMPCIVGILTGKDSGMQLEAAWCLTNIAAGTPEHALLVASQAAPYFITYLASNCELLQDQCAWAIGNIAGDAKGREVLIAQGALKPLVDLLDASHAAVIKSAGFALSNLLKQESDHVARTLVELHTIGKLMKLLEYTSNTHEVMSEAAWVLTYLAASGKHEAELKEAGAVSILSQLIVKLAENCPEEYQVLTPVLRCLGNLSSGAEEISLDLCSLPVFLPALGRLLASEHRHIKKETLWALSNMLSYAGVCKKAIAAEIVPRILKLIPGAFDIKTEAAYCVCNMSVHGPEISSALLDAGAMEAMTPLLKMHDLELVHVALGYMRATLSSTPNGKQLFEEAGGLAGLERWEYHENNTIRLAANDILDNFFYKGDEEDTSQDKKAQATAAAGDTPMEHA